MKLYSGPLSLFTGEVRIALDEKGLAHELVSVPFGRANGCQPKHPDVLPGVYGLPQSAGMRTAGVSGARGGPSSG